MSSKLDPSILAAITEEARQCFLDEDAPEYLQMLEEGIKQRDSDFTLLLRAAHSIKGGAGLASLDSLQELAHKLEDVLIGIQQGQIQEVDFAWNLVERGVNEVALILSQARTVDQAIADPELVEALGMLASFAGESETDNLEEQNQDSSDNSFVKNTLTTDLETTFAAIEELTDDLPAELIEQLLTGFADECGFLGETLNLPWLTEATAAIASAVESSPPTEALAFTKEIITALRGQRDAYLNDAQLELPAATETATDNNDDFVTQTLTTDLESSLNAIGELTEDTPPELIGSCLMGFADECTFLGETLNLPWLVELVKPIENILTKSPPENLYIYTQTLVTQIRQQRDRYLQGDLPQPKVDIPTASPKAQVVEKSRPQTAALSQLRIPLHKLDGMTNNVEELILTQARLTRQQKLLNQANRRLRELTRQFEPIREQVQHLYDRLAVGSTNISSTQSSANSPQSTPEILLDTDETGFDALELDRYTELHTSLQSFQELMLRVQETRTDLELVDRELAEDLEQTQKNLDTLYTKITESRLVPFRFLANRFIPQIRNLNQRFDKSVNLEIIGENTSIDQVLLEQLQTPLTHLLNNAFDHGIESKAERLARQKPESAQIFLKATVENNQLVIVIQDDGGGIDIQKVYQRGIAKGICPQNKSIDDFTSDEIIDWIFHPGFSTAAKVSDISGRGMGLDIVRSQIRKLRGNLQVQTKLNQGTIFTLKLPLNLSLMSLLLIQLQNRVIAMPNSSVIETIPYSELQFIGEDKQSIQWHQQTLPVMSVANLLPCPRQPLLIDRAKVAIIIETSFGLVAILVDSLIREEKLIVKPFDDTIPVPTYLAGCTVLGTGEVIPVILPQGFEQSATSVTATPTTATVASNITTILVAEDSVATRRMLEKVLTAVGYQTIMCRDGQEALDRLKLHPGKIDLILSDVEMPKVNGFELLQQVRANDAYKNTPVVMATSRTGDRHKQEAMRLGANDYLGKPVQPQELLDTVAALLVGR